MHSTHVETNKYYLRKHKTLNCILKNITLHLCADFKCENLTNYSLVRVLGYLIIFTVLL